MSDKKRKKSYNERMKRERLAEEEQVKAKKKKEIILMSVIGVLIFALAFGIVFGGIAIYKSLQKKDYCEYAQEYEKSDFRMTYTAKINIKDYGTVTVLLVHDAAPLTVNGFISRSHEGYYDGLTIDTVMPGVMLGGGESSSWDDADKIKAEASGAQTLPHIRGVFSMASIDDDGSTGSGFIICTGTNKDTEAFDKTHTPIGYVTGGLKIIDQIIEDTRAYANDSGVITDAARRIVIESIEIVDFAQDSDNELPPDTLG